MVAAPCRGARRASCVGAVVLAVSVLLLVPVMDVRAQSAALLTEARVEVRAALRTALGQVLQGRAVTVTLPQADDTDGVHTGTKVLIDAMRVLSVRSRGAPLSKRSAVMAWS